MFSSNFLVEVAPELHGHFYSADSYVIMYKYFFRGWREQYIIYYFQGPLPLFSLSFPISHPCFSYTYKITGRTSRILEKGTSALLTVELDEEVGRSAKEVKETRRKKERKEGKGRERSSKKN